MSAPIDQDLSRREELSVSGAAMSSAPWGGAAVTGGVVTAADLGLHVIGGTAFHLAAFSGSLSLGVAVFAMVAAGGALWQSRGRAARWARTNPWRFAMLPAVLAGAIALVLSVVTGGGVVDGIWSGVWHGGAVYGVTGAIGSMARSRKQK